MEKGIKVGDRVRVSEDAPRVYTDGWRLDWRNSDSLVRIVEEDDAVISPDDSGGEELAIPCKYLVKVDTDAKKAKFKVGDMVRYRLDGKRYEVMGKTGKYHYALNGYDSDVLESDLEPYTEPTEQTEVEKPNVGSIKIPVEVDLRDGYWDAYTADLAKEIALKVANKFNDPKEAAGYAVSVAKAVVEWLKEVRYGIAAYIQQKR